MEEQENQTSNETYWRRAIIASAIGGAAIGIGYNISQTHHRTGMTIMNAGLESAFLAVLYSTSQIAYNNNPEKYRI